MLEYVTLFGFLLFAMIGCLVFLKSKSTHRLIAKSRGKDQNSTKVYWIQERTERDGTVWWVSWPLAAVKTLKPPSEAIEFTPNGRKIASGYLKGKDEVLWIKTTMTEKLRLAEEQFINVSATDRASLINQMEKAQREKMERLTTAQVIMNIAPITIMGMVILFGLMYSADIFAGFQKVQAAQTESEKVQLQVTQQQARLMQAMGIKVEGVSASQDLTTTNPTTSITTTGETPPTQ